MEATATRRAGLERFTFPSDSKPYFVLDLENDLPVSFKGGQLTIDPEKGRINIGGRSWWGSRFDAIIPNIIEPLLIPPSLLYLNLALDPGVFPTKHLHVMIFSTVVNKS